MLVNDKKDKCCSTEKEVFFIYDTITAACESNSI